jgi:hypothetical protein
VTFFFGLFCVVELRLYKDLPYAVAHMEGDAVLVSASSCVSCSMVLESPAVLKNTVKICMAKIRYCENLPTRKLISV